MSPARLVAGLSALCSGTVLLIVTHFPGPLGHVARRGYWSRRLRHLGRDVRIDPAVAFVNPEWISIGDRCWIDQSVILQAGPTREAGRRVHRRPNPDYHHEEGELVIGPEVHVAPFAVISAHGGVWIEGTTTVASGARVYSLTHHHRNLDDPTDDKLYVFTSNAPAENQALLSSPVVLRRQCALALNSIALPGVTIGENTWVSASSVVRWSLPAGCIASGDPAVPRRWRPGYQAPPDA